MHTLDTASPPYNGSELTSVYTSLYQVFVAAEPRFEFTLAAASVKILAW
jgi:hypothetical protein